MSEQQRLELVKRGMDTVRGRYLEALEVLGLPERQFEAIKRLVRRETYGLQQELERAVKENDAR